MVENKYILKIVIILHLATPLVFSSPVNPLVLVDSLRNALIMLMVDRKVETFHLVTPMIEDSRLVEKMQ